jgi:hypothetical protein
MRVLLGANSYFPHPRNSPVRIPSIPQRLVGVLLTRLTSAWGMLSRRAPCA